MIREAFASEETIALAKMKACEILGVGEQEAEFEIVQTPEKKKLGFFGGRMAQVRAFIKETPAEKAKNYVKEILFYMGLESLKIEVESENNDLCVLRVDGEEIKYIVGRHGETLDALQYLAGFVANTARVGKYCRIRIEAGNYREKRKKSLEAYGRRMAREAVKSGSRIDLEPMRSYERKVVHTAIQEVDGARSWSEGENLNRHVVIVPHGASRGERPFKLNGQNTGEELSNWEKFSSE